LTSSRLRTPDGSTWHREAQAKRFAQGPSTPLRFAQDDEGGGERGACQHPAHPPPRAAAPGPPAARPRRQLARDSTVHHRLFGRAAAVGERRAGHRPLFARCDQTPRSAARGLGPRRPAR
jgi:hypothetical protein